jgi:hypothetical protein
VDDKAVGTVFAPRTAQQAAGRRAQLPAPQLSAAESTE